MTGAAPAIALDGVSHVFAGATPVEALRDVSLVVQEGTFASLLGPSGCGKSTILRMLSGLLVPSAGSVAIAGADARGRSGLTAYMPQRDLLLPWRRVEENATFGAEMAGADRDEARARARALLDQFGLAGFEHAWPSQLSGGMRQRLALLRTFLMPRQTLLLDEPFGALDAITRREMQEWLQGVWMGDRRSVLLVTHDVDEALVLSDVVFVMSSRPGRIAAEVAVDLPRPRGDRDLTSARFVALKTQVLTALRGETEPK
jgi:ABC-type nitrate/sulfonate/bicarbonate transport system ATPase subunit